MKMRNTLKLKIFASFTLLIAILAIAGTISIVKFRSISNSVQDLIKDNYKSIKASKTMLEALEREDSGVLLLMLGEWKEGREIINAADSTFLKAFETTKHNLTEKNEAEYIQKIKTEYTNYKAKWKRPVVKTDKQGNITWYKTDIHQSFLRTKKAVDSLMTLNQESMYGEASDLNRKATRAIMPGIVSIIAALIFAIILNFFINRYFVGPISDMVKAVKNHQEGDKELNVNITSNDEIKQLEQAINKLLHRLGRNF